jgi:drug/metabolite transporter (DMT)-like permease
LALAAAFLHAGWNVLLRGSEDVAARTVAVLCLSVVLFAPVAAATWSVHASALPYVAASAVFEAVYFVLLTAAYRRRELSVVYPIARGSAPVLVLLAGALVSTSRPSAAAACGVLLVAAGIVFVRGVGTASSPRDLALALGVGACIAGYTLVDKHGVTHGNPLAYLQVVFSIAALGYLAGAWRARGPAAIRAAVNPSSLVAGVGFFGSYALTLAALRLAPAASVAAVRESSVVIAAGALIATGREPAGRGRLGGAALVAAGVAVISLG